MKQVQGHEMSTTWNTYKYMKQLQVHETSISPRNKCKYMKQVQLSKSSTCQWNKYKYTKQVQEGASTMKQN